MNIKPGWCGGNERGARGLWPSIGFPKSMPWDRKMHEPPANSEFQQCSVCDEAPLTLLTGPEGNQLSNPALTDAGVPQLCLIQEVC